MDRCRTFRLVLAGLLVGTTIDAVPARAFAPAVPRALARQALEPATTDAARLLADAAATAVSAQLAAEESVPETFAASHAWFVPPGSSTATDGFGTAPRVLGEAWSALVEAERDGDPAAVGRAAARLAVAASDLADPFRTAGPDRAGPPGARARFCDRLDEAEVSAAIAGAADRSPASFSTADQVEAAGRRLGEESAARRDAVETRSAVGQEAEFSALRRERLDAAASLVRALAASARIAAGTGRAATAGASPAGPLLVLPNPAPSGAALAFRAPSAGLARVRIVGPDGRRVADFSTPIAASGAVTIALDPWLPRGLAPGAYFARVSAPGLEATSRFVRTAR